MIVNMRLEVTDEQRNALARLNKPSAPKRVATRDEVKEYVEGAIRALTARVDAAPPEPVVVDIAPLNQEDIEKHGTGVTCGAPEDPVKRDLFLVNNAIFSVGRCRRTDDFSERDAAMEALQELRDRLVEELAERGEA